MNYYVSEDFVPREIGDTVTVVIPLYNHRRYIREAVESVLASTVQDLELVVIDDGSVDGGAEVVKQIGDPRIRLVEQTNQGAHAAIGRGVSLASNRWIAILNSDDRFHVKKLERHLAAHAQRPDIEATSSRVRYIDETGAPFGENSFLSWNYHRIRQRSWKSNSLFESLLLSNHLITTSSLFIRKDVFEEIGGLLPLRYVHDWFMFLTLAARGRFMVIEEDLVDYRRHAANTILENDDKGKIEDNFVLDWHMARSLNAASSSTTSERLKKLVTRNKRASARLMDLFAGWRKTQRGDLDPAVSVFEQEGHPVMERAYEILGQELGRVNPKVLLRKLLGSGLYSNLADCLAVCSVALNRLGRERSGIARACPRLPWVFDGVPSNRRNRTSGLVDSVTDHG